MPDRRHPPPVSSKIDNRSSAPPGPPRARPARTLSTSRHILKGPMRVKRADARDTPIHPDSRTAPSSRPEEATADPARGVKIGR
jgi:hypothetical protein